MRGAERNGSACATSNDAPRIPGALAAGALVHGGTLTAGTPEMDLDLGPVINARANPPKAESFKAYSGLVALSARGVMATNTPGVLDKAGNLITGITPKQIDDMVEDGTTPVKVEKLE